MKWIRQTSRLWVVFEEPDHTPFALLEQSLTHVPTKWIFTAPTLSIDTFLFGPSFEEVVGIANEKISKAAQDLIAKLCRLGAIPEKTEEPTKIAYSVADALRTSAEWLKSELERKSLLQHTHPSTLDRLEQTATLLERWSAELNMVGGNRAQESKPSEGQAETSNGPTQVFPEVELVRQCWEELLPEIRAGNFVATAVVLVGPLLPNGRQSTRTAYRMSEGSPAFTLLGMVDLVRSMILETIRGGLQTNEHSIRIPR